MRTFGLISALFIFFVLPFISPALRVSAQTPMENFACTSVKDATQKKYCDDCMSSDTPGAWTAIGCIHTDPTDLLSTILKFAMGIAGGIAFLLILFGGFQILTSAGNPENLNAGRELVTSAITGLLLIIFSVFILQFIGVNIIGIPGFG